MYSLLRPIIELVPLDLASTRAIHARLFDLDSTRRQNLQEYCSILPLGVQLHFDLLYVHNYLFALYCTRLSTRSFIVICHLYRILEISLKKKLLEDRERKEDIPIGK